MTPLAVANSLVFVVAMPINIWYRIGRSRAFRNPWVRIPAIGGTIAGVGVMLSALILRWLGQPTPDWLPIVALLLHMLGWVVAWFEGVRLRERIEDIVGESLGEHPVYLPLEHEIELMFGTMAEQKLTALQQLIAKTGGAPGTEWLTRAWVDQRLAHLRLAARSIGEKPLVE